MPNNLRLFIAIELPPNVLTALGDVQQQLQRDPALARLRWMRPEGIHLTLKFLGETPADRRAAIEAALGRTAAGIGPFELRLGKLGNFGSRNAPRVVWVDVEDDIDALHRLQSAVEREIAPLGWPAEKRAFSPHLTLARVPEERARDVAATLETALTSATAPSASFEAREVALMRSELQRSGAVYTQLFAAGLTA